MLRTFVYILLWVLIMGVAIFASQNLTLVTIKLFIFESIRLPLGLVLVTCAGAGGVVATLWQVSARAQRRQFTDRVGSKRVNASRGNAASFGDRKSSSRSKQSRQSKQSGGGWEDDWLDGKDQDDWL
ncbi:hypothetical protein Pse7367_3161 [Thalassoporum mexicanum PCC 7367]|uniref:lipopolysaccharide assembly protein LapA domain-containing protein n=1 Tax=Thalassoporum mexicanum TaxID=3457544 RepID=UPI00029FA993|nr:lipopolysaccharide assembly protein LapA domain-containing protein [Pseudanabaena sp. PCC 7367]AFY71409.1 hypothetical protein Pse7367_3161 [Pseudanabaena sp. PCC 7367]